MVRELRNKSFGSKLRSLASSKMFIPAALLLMVLSTIPTIQLLTSGTLDIRQNASQGSPGALIIKETMDNDSYALLHQYNYGNTQEASKNKKSYAWLLPFGIVLTPILAVVIFAAIFLRVKKY